MSPLRFPSDKKLVFDYDYMSRRVRTRAFAWTGSAWPDPQTATPEVDDRFVSDEWNVIMVLDGLSSNAITRKYTWGLDLSGTLHSAGGIGGLLAVEETSGTHQGSYWFFYDANGNVGQLIHANGTNYPIAAKYEYDAYGNALVASGTYAANNRFSFSTKWQDSETGLYYYGHRYYNSQLGRWLGNDPITELGFDVIREVRWDLVTTLFPSDGLLNAMQNDPVGRYDYLGLLSPCAAAKQNGDDEGDWGGVVCKNGKKHYCVWTPPGTNPGIDYCVGEHEKTHGDDVTCPDDCSGKVTRPPWDDKSKANAEECKGYTAELECLNKEKSYRCNKLTGEAKVACIDAFGDRIKNVTVLKDKYCAAASTQPRSRGRCYGR